MKSIRTYLAYAALFALVGALTSPVSAQTARQAKRPLAKSAPATKQVPPATRKPAPVVDHTKHGTSPAGKP